VSGTRAIWIGTIKPMPAAAAPFLKAATVKNRFGGNKYALQNKDTVISLPETFEVSRALQKKIQIECGKEKRAADLLSAALGFGCAAIARTGHSHRVRFGFLLDDGASAFLCPWRMLRNERACF
jgi:hypothetical protein